MLSRREFIKASTLAGGAVFLNFRKTWGKPSTSEFFALNDFIQSHPDAVFILRTSVDEKTNASALLDVGQKLGATLFVGKEDPVGAFSVDTEIILKPNITAWAWDIPPIEQTMGIQTDPYFVEGIISSLTNLGAAQQNLFIREANYDSSRADGKWYSDLAARSGIDLKVFDTVDKLSAADVKWLDVPNGVWYNKIPYLSPVNAPRSCLVNIAKFKSHSMGMTLCSKNIQGTNARPYVAHCTAWGTTMAGVDPNHVVPDAFTAIKSNYDRHVAAGIPRWDIPGAASGGLWMETHTARCLDNNSVVQPIVNIIEGVYGREGPFVSGPEDNNGYGRDIMTNVVIFGKNARHVDVIGTYLAGHEPGNFGLFHIAIERGLSKYLDPNSIPLYEWKLDGSATLTPLQNFPRTPIRTLYLQKAGEPQYHMVNEPYDYSGTTLVASAKPDKPDVFHISQNYPNPFNPSTSIQYYIPKSGNVRLEIFDIRGSLVDVLVDNYAHAGDHVAVWNSQRKASGTYFYRLLYEGSSQTKSMVLLK
jgi:uncharacterized protein (DUF362 family)